MRHGFAVRGLTTAAAPWIVPATGMAVGAEFYEGAALTTVSGLVALIGFRVLRRRGAKPHLADWVLVELTAETPKSLSKALTALRDVERVRDLDDISAVEVPAASTDRGRSGLTPRSS